MKQTITARETTRAPRSGRMGKRLLPLALTLAICLSLLPVSAMAAQTGSSDTKRTVFDALGFDTGVPEGYEQEEGITDTPFGKSYSTLAEVDELFVHNTNSNHNDGKNGNSESTTSLFGNGTATGGSLSGFFSNAKTYAAPNLSSNAILAVEGNFSTGNNGLKKDVVLLTYFTTRTSEHVRMYTGDPVNGSYSNYKGLPGSGGLGNADDKSNGRFAEPYMAYNYLDLAAGDFDGDGIDEIATYVGSNRAPIVTVWKLQKTADDGFLTASNWVQAWSYALPTTDSLAPNMVSLAAADIDKDGIDDLAISYGYYKYNSAAQASKAVVLMGADNSKMMTRSYDLSLGTVYRAGLTAGDIDNDGRNELIVGGSSDTKNRDARYLAIYGWNGTGFDKLAAKNVNPMDGSSGLSDKYYMSLPYMAANLTVGKFYGLSDGPCIYMDSIILRYGTGGIEVLDLADKHTNYFYGTDFEGVNDHLFYVEWNARAADFTGSGQEAVGVNRMAPWVAYSDRDSGQDRDHTFAYEAALGGYTFKNQHLNILSFGGSGQNRTVSNVYHQYASPSGYEVVDGELDITPRAVPFCLPDTDNDTIVLKYTGEHYYTYADPEVLAVLASPPYFADLANDDDDSQMIESKTAYSKSKGSGSGSGYSNSFSVGVYTSWEQSFSILGVELAHAEAEAAINNSFTWETQNSASVEYEVAYSTMAGMDSVVLYALPVETYVYEATMPGGETQTMTVNKPYQPAVRTISAEDYAEIQAVYSDILPDVTPVLRHTVGDPASYAADVSALPDGRTQTLVYDGSFAAIGQGSQNTISQSIAMTSETENSFNYDLEVETKAGAGIGGVTLGVTAGYSHGAGMVHITTAGSSYSGEMNGLPTQAGQYGYSFHWKLVGFLYQGKYPVVTYLVNSVTEPPLLPENFGANEAETTTDQIALEWDYPGNAAGFVIYRYLQSPSAAGYYKIGTVEGGDYTEVRSGVKHYQFIDKGLQANTGYQYRIQTIGLSQPNTSIPSEAYSTYTKPETDVPQVGVSTGQLALYPDVKAGVTAFLENSDVFTDSRIFYQWQKQSAGGWETVEGEKAASLTFQYPDLGVEGLYRCKVSAMVGQNLVTAYSPEVTVTFAQRSSQITGLTIQDDTLTATVTGSGSTAKPTGTVNFILRSANAETVYTAQVEEDGTASVTIHPAADLYKITATYSGSKIFLPASYDPETPLFYTKGVQSGSYVDVKDSYFYGDVLQFDKYTVTNDGSVTKTQIQPTSWKSKPTAKQADDTAAIESRFASGRAGWVGKAAFTEGGKTYTVQILPRPIEVIGLEDYSFATGSGSAYDIMQGVSLRNLVEDWAEEDSYVKTSKGTIRALNLVFYNSAGKEVTPVPGGPGAYTAYLEKGDLSRNVNYSLTSPTVKLTITGKTYPVSAGVQAGQETCGTASVRYPKDTQQAAVGQTVIFQADPNPGYAVDTWYQVGKDGSSTKLPDSEGKQTLTMTQTKDGLALLVGFRKKSNTLTVAAQPERGGKVTTDDRFFQNGNAYTADYAVTFTAVPEPGWHFTGWEYRVAGQAPKYDDGESFTVTMPDESVQLYAKFARDSYKLRLSEGLEAYADGAAIADLDAVLGDTVVTVQPKKGYQLSEDAVWQVNGTALETQPTEGKYYFTMTEDTQVSVALTAQEFAVRLEQTGVTGGTAALQGVSPEGTASAGTPVTYTAAPDRGYTFQGWKNTADDSLVSTSASYTFAVSGDVSLTPVFAAQTGKTITAAEGIRWTITAGDDAEIETDMLRLFPGETLTLTATPRDGYMVAGWTVNDKYTATPARTMRFSYQELEDGTRVSVTYKPVTYFTVRFAGGITATADGAAIASGDSVAAGSTMRFAYSGTDGLVTAWKNKGEAYPSLTRELLVDPLTGDLDITVEIGELAFFTVTDANSEAEKPYTAAVTGAYAENDRYAAHSAVKIVITPAEGYHICKVECGGMDFAENAGVWTGTTAAIQENLVYTVSVEKDPQPCTITLDANGGTLGGAATIQTGTDGKLAALPEVPTRSGYRFDGWYTEKESGEAVTTETVFARDTTLYAHWTKRSSSGGGGGTVTKTYPVNIVLSTNGSLTVDKKTAASGETVAVTASPSGGYALEKITVVDKNGKTIQVTEKNGKYSFTMPASPVTVSAVFQANSKQFADVTRDAYFYDAVQWAVQQGIAQGVSDTRFDPDGACTRAQIVTFLWRAKGSPEPAGRKTPFTDVAADAYYAKAVQWAVENGITQGTAETRFSPDDSCTRAQSVTLLYRANGAPAVSGTMPFADVAKQAYYHDAVQWAVQQKITQGTGENSFSPDEDCTRAQIVTLIYRCMK